MLYGYFLLFLQRYMWFCHTSSWSPVRGQLADSLMSMRNLQWPVRSRNRMSWSVRGAIIGEGCLVGDYSLHFCAWSQLASCFWWAIFFFVTKFEFWLLLLASLFYQLIGHFVSPCMPVYAGIHWSTAVVLDVRLFILFTRLCKLLSSGFPDASDYSTDNESMRSTTLFGLVWMYMYQHFIQCIPLRGCHTITKHCAIYSIAKLFRESPFMLRSD